MDTSAETLKGYIGKHISDLPTPSLVLSEGVIEKNCQRLLRDVADMGIGFRAHVKTLKCVEVTRMMLGKHKKVVVSTLREARGLLSLIEEGQVEELLYGLPCVSSALPELYKFRSKVKVQLMVDNASHLETLRRFSEQQQQREGLIAPVVWDIFIKVDMGTKRAGISLTSPRLQELVRGAEESEFVQIHGFYCHAGHSYASKTPEGAAAILGDEVGEAFEASKFMSSTKAITISVGATPTAHVVRLLQKELPDHVQLELHAGNYPANDLQQVATGSVGESDQAVRVTAEVCSVYPERNEAIINAGVIALARESGPLPGFACLVDSPSWNVGRLSQEHGIIVSSEVDGGAGTAKVEDVLKCGQKVQLYIQHACITASAFTWYFVVDEKDVVKDVWYPWRGW